MRTRNTADGLSVQGIGGSHVVLLGWDYPKARCNGLMGFAVHRTDHAEEEAGWLRGLKTFAATDPAEAKHLDVLRTRNASLLPSDDYRPPIGAVEPEEALDESRLSRAVLTKERVEGTGREPIGNVCERLDRAKAFRQTNDLYLWR